MVAAFVRISALVLIIVAALLDRHRAHADTPAESRAVATIQHYGGEVLVWRSDRKILTEVRLGESWRAGDAIMAVLELSDLRKISFHGKSLGELFSRYPQNARGPREAVTNDGFRHLSSMTDLENIDLSGTTADDTTIGFVKNLTKLEVLDLTSTRVRGSGLHFLRGTTSLRVLLLEHVKLDNSSIEDDAAFQRLQALYIGDSNLDDQGLERLLPLENLTTLDLANNKVSDRSVQSLKVLKSLEFVNLRGTNVTSEGAEELRAALPGARIVD